MNYPAWQLKVATRCGNRTGWGRVRRTAAPGSGRPRLHRPRRRTGGCWVMASRRSDPFLLGIWTRPWPALSEPLNEELTVIYGDYDVDGISATRHFVRTECLTSQGARALQKTAAAPATSDPVGAGIVGKQGLQARDYRGQRHLGREERPAAPRNWTLDLIITDHHLPGDTLPEAIAVSGPKRLRTMKALSRDLCGAGVAFKLCARRWRAVTPPSCWKCTANWRRWARFADDDAAGGGKPHHCAGGLALATGHHAPGLHALLERAQAAAASR